MEISQNILVTFLTVLTITGVLSVCFLHGVIPNGLTIDLMVIVCFLTRFQNSI